MQVSGSSGTGGSGGEGAAGSSAGWPGLGLCCGKGRCGFGSFAGEGGAPAGGRCGTLPTGPCALVRRKVTLYSGGGGTLYLREQSVSVCLAGKAPPRSQYTTDLLREVEKLQAPGACGCNLDRDAPSTTVVCPFSAANTQVLAEPGDKPFNNCSTNDFWPFKE